MIYEQLTDRCFSDSIGARGLDPADFDAELRRLAPALESLRSEHGSGAMPLLRLPGATEDLNALRPVADRFRTGFSDVAILGTGGSSLGGQTLYALADQGFGPPGGIPKLHFLDNVDPFTIAAFLSRYDPGKTGFVVISKSGSTTETVTQFLICLGAVREALGEEACARHFVAITEPGDNPLRRAARRFRLAVLDHDPGVGGRYSALSLVGLLPAMIASLDAAAIRSGAMDVLRPVLEGGPIRDIPPAVGAALSVGLYRTRGIATTVLMPYVDRLAHFGLWFRQLWAESLGKDGMGTTPVRAVGTVDQHSQLQLYLDGPADKMFTIVMLDCAGQGPGVPAELAEDEALAYVAGKTIGDVMDAEQRATVETLALNGRPTRVMRIDRLDERVMGGLMMHFMLETMLAAALLGVNAFDQPAVEQGKVLTRQYLSGAKAEA